MVNERQMMKGRRISVERLLATARALHELASQYSEALATRGWTKTEKLGQDIERLAALAQKRGSATAGSRQSVTQLKETVAEVKALVSSLRQVVIKVLRERSLEGVTAEDFKIGALDKGGFKLLAYLDRVEPHLRKVNALVAPYLGQSSALESLSNARTKLSATLESRKVAEHTQQDEKLSAEQLRGEILDQLEELRLCAKLALDPDKARFFEFSFTKRSKAKTPPAA